MDQASVDTGPGLHRLRDADPARRAAAVAQQLGVTVRSTTEAVDDLLAGLPEVPVTTEDLDRLDRVARRLSRLSAVADRTFERATATMNDKLVTAAGGLAIHLDTVRSRAAAVESARTALAELDAAIAEHEGGAAEPASASEEAPEPSVVPPSDDGGARPPRLPSLRLRQSRSIGAVVGAFGLGMVLLGAGVLPLWAALVVPLLAALWASWYLRDRHEEDLAHEAEEIGSSRLAEVAATTALAFGGPAEVDPEAEWDRALDLLRTRRARAEEDLRVAERAWTDLAGAGADVAEVEDVVKRFDAQHTGAATAAAATPQVRASQVVRDQVEAEWAEMWARLGEEPPSAGEAVVAAGALRARASRPVVLVGAAVEQAEEVARVLTLAPVVAVEAADQVTAEPEVS